MNGVVATIGAASSVVVAETGAAVADLLHARVRAVGPARGLPGTTEAVLGALQAADVTVAVMADGAAFEETAGHLIVAPPKPLVVVPSVVDARRPVTISRVLVPLDGTWEAAATVAPTAELFAHAGVDLVVLHVFDRATVPGCWDQAAHARGAWEAEFLARYCPHPGVRLRLRSGTPGEHVVTVAAEERVDLITLGWSRRVNRHRARTVRRTVAEAGVPVMLMPVSRHATAPSGPDD